MVENGNNNGNGLNLEGLATIAGSAKGVAFLNLVKQIKGGKKLTAHDLELLNEIEKKINGQQQETEPLQKEKVKGSDRYFETQAQVLRYLQAEGWKIKKSTLSNHVKEARLRPNAGGVFTSKAALDYAKANLVTENTRQKLKAEEQQTKKAAKELEKLDEDIKE